MSEANNTTEAQGQLATPAEVVEESLTPQQYYENFKTQAGEWWRWACAQEQEWKGWDQRWARNIADFKKEYIFSLGDLMNRSICMAVAGGLTYKLISFNTTSFIRRTRNLGVSFVLNGWIFVPELFNPYLARIE